MSTRQLREFSIFNTDLSLILTRINHYSHQQLYTAVTVNVTTTFKDIKKALANATLLAHFKLEAIIKIITGASNMATGKVLYQHLDRTWLLSLSKIITCRVIQHI